MVVASVMVKQCEAGIGFFDIVRLCHELDSEVNNEGAHRVTKFYIIDGRVIFKVLHSEFQCIWAQAIELNEDNDLVGEIRKLHRIIDGRVRSDRKFVEDLGWPPPF